MTESTGKDSAERDQQLDAIRKQIPDSARPAVRTSGSTWVNRGVSDFAMQSRMGKPS